MTRPTTNTDVRRLAALLAAGINARAAGRQLGRSRGWAQYWAQRTATPPAVVCPAPDLRVTVRLLGMLTHLQRTIAGARDCGRWPL